MAGMMRYSIQNPRTYLIYIITTEYNLLLFCIMGNTNGYYAYLGIFAVFDFQMNYHLSEGNGRFLCQVKNFWNILVCRKDVAHRFNYVQPIGEVAIMNKSHPTSIWESSFASKLTIVHSLEIVEYRHIRILGKQIKWPALQEENWVQKGIARITQPSAHENIHVIIIIKDQQLQRFLERTSSPYQGFPRSRSYLWDNGGLPWGIAYQPKISETFSSF